jgi:uncharacterized membrane protein YfcA
VTFALAAGALIVAAASFVQGLAGFGIGLVALAFLPFLITPTDAVVLMTLYATLFCGVIFVPLRRDFHLGGVDMLLVGSFLGTPLGVWVLATVSASLLARLIGSVLVLIVALEWSGLSPHRLSGRGWGLPRASSPASSAAPSGRRGHPPSSTWPRRAGACAPSRPTSRRFSW